MNEVFRNTGEFTHLTHTESGQGDPVLCLAACEDQTHEFLISKSVYPNRSGYDGLRNSISLALFAGKH